MSAAIASSFPRSGSMASSYGSTMEQYSGASRHLSVKKASDVGSRVIDFLRKRYPQKTAEHVSADTGIASATISKWIERASVPGGIAIIVLTASYGPEFLNTIMHSPPAWLDEAARSEEQRKIKAEIAALQAKLDRSA